MIELIKTPNQSFRKKVKIDMIVIHATENKSFDDSLAWLTNSKSGISAHYLIGKDGKCVQLAEESKKAWHCGKSAWGQEDNLNENSIGIELVNSSNGRDPYPDEQIDMLARLIVDIQHYYKDIPDDRILGHSQISAKKNDPGIEFPWVKLGILIAGYRQKVRQVA